MKESLTIASMLLGLISCQNSYDSGLVAYDPFEGDARDYSGNDNYGVINGSVLTFDRFGQENSAFRFDGEKSTILVYVKDIPGVDLPQSFSRWY